MSRPPDVARRQKLLDRLIEVFATGGIGTRSLRDIAEVAGTSHRMLLHHFGSREELLIEIVEEVERRQAAKLVEMPDDPADAFAAMWADLRRPELRPFERLFFECYARGAQGEAPFARLIPAAVDGWLAAVSDAVNERSGGAADPALARLGLAVTRGLLLDLVATDDSDGVDAAAAVFAALLGSATPAPPGGPGRRPRSGATSAARGR
jgi:AcrR family transcriptional regulator